MGPTAATIVFAPCDFNCQEKSQGEAVRNLNNDRLIFLSMIYSHLSILLLSCFVDWNEFFFSFCWSDDEINTHRQRSISSKNRWWNTSGERCVYSRWWWGLVNDITYCSDRKQPMSRDGAATAPVHWFSTTATTTTSPSTCYYCCPPSSSSLRSFSCVHRNPPAYHTVYFLPPYSSWSCILECRVCSSGSA